MRLLIQAAMIFFGTLMAAGLVALGEPQAVPPVAGQAGTDRGLLMVLEGPWPGPTVAPAAR